MKKRIHGDVQLRALTKRYLYGSAPLYRGRFPYYGQHVYFPRGSLLFVRACQEGIYEAEIVKLITSLVRPETTCIDVGANIGLIAIPILAEQRSARVLSIEASPRTLEHLAATHSASAYRDRWMLVGTAVGRERGKLEFWTAQPENASFDGFKDTGRGGAKQSVTVEVQPLDDVWTSAGRPNVSVIKIDVEGAEADVIAGAHGLIARDHPALVIEWSALNLPAYGIEPEHLFEICREIGYRAFAHPNLCEIDDEHVLRAAMAQTETFLLVPDTRAKA